MVQFQWHYEGDHPVRIKDYLKHLGIPRKFVSHVKFEGGNILLNGQEVNVLAKLEAGDVLTLVAADEEATRRCHLHMFPSRSSTKIGTY